MPLPGAREGEAPREAPKTQPPSALGSPTQEVTGYLLPTGTVLDDVSDNHMCVPLAHCPCRLAGARYTAGEVSVSACRSW